MSFTQVQTNSSSESATVTLNGVTAGNLIVVACKWENSKNNISVSDGTDSFSVGTRAESASADGVMTQFAYLLSSTSGNKTYTATLSGSPTVRRMIVWEFSATGTISFDSQNVGNGNSSSAATGTFSTTGTDELCIASAGLWSSSQEPASNQQIGGQAADATFTYGSSIAGYAWREAFTSTQSGITATCSLAGSTEWAIAVIAFKAETGPPPEYKIAWIRG